MKHIKQMLTLKNISALFFFCISILAIVKLNQIQHRIGAINKSHNPFCEDNILNKYEHKAEWDVKTAPETLTFVNLISQQPFHWLGKGFQAYAFLSQDGQYVLKFIQQKRLREDPAKSHPVDYFFSKEFRDKMEFRQKHREEIFSSSKLSFEEISEETGILYVHLNKSNELVKRFKLYDVMGQMHKINGDDVSFVLQRKATYICPTIINLMEQGNVDAAKVRLNQIFDLLLSLARKNIVDFDYALIQNNNIGFVKDRAIYIDTGHIAKVENLNIVERMNHEFSSRLKPLHAWLKFNYPELQDHFEKKTVEILASLETEAASCKQVVQEETPALSLSTKP